MRCYYIYIHCINFSEVWSGKRSEDKRCPHCRLQTAANFRVTSHHHLRTEYAQALDGQLIFNTEFIENWWNCRVKLAISNSCQFMCRTGCRSASVRPSPQNIRDSSCSKQMRIIERAVESCCHFAFSVGHLAWSVQTSFSSKEKETRGATGRLGCWRYVPLGWMTAGGIVQGDWIQKVACSVCWFRASP